MRKTYERGSAIACQCPRFVVRPRPTPAMRFLNALTGKVVVYRALAANGTIVVDHLERCQA